jgi:hypothetical protein
MCALPTFFLAGAPKAGTTSLYHDLRRHPNLCMSEPKETWYFFDHRKYEQGLDWYESEFFGQCAERKIIGEATPGYMAHPESPFRIADSLGAELQFLFLLRDPVERAFSHYHYDIQRGVRSPSRTFSEVIRDPYEQTADPAQNHVGLVEAGRYICHLKRYEQCFGREPLTPVLFSEYTNKRTETLGRIFEALSLAPTPIPESGLQNATQYPLSSSLFSVLKCTWRTAEQALGPVVEYLDPVRDVVRQSLLTSDRDRPSMKAADRSYLRDFYAEANASLAEYLDRSLSHWTYNNSG